MERCAEVPVYAAFALLNSANFEIHSVSIKVLCERKLEIWGDVAWFSVEENAVTLLVSVTVHFPKLAVVDEMGHCLFET